MAMVGGILGVGATSTITPEQREKWKAEQIHRHIGGLETRQALFVF